jgi:hypothetical protein
MTKAKFALSVIILLITAACERVESVYPDARAAISAGEIERGWIPAFLPPSAKDIHVKYDLDTNEVWLRFSMDPSEVGSIENSCRRIETVEAVLPERAGFWWPERLTEEQGSALHQSGGYTHYRCENGGSIAIKRAGREVLYWHHG